MLKQFLKTTELGLTRCEEWNRIFIEDTFDCFFLLEGSNEGNEGEKMNRCW